MQVQQELFAPRKPRGGKRRGAGRPARGARSGVSHAVRSELKARFPVHVVLRVVSAIGSLRRREIYHAIRRATLRAAKRKDFRIAQLSIQRTHVHLLVEADDKRALARGMQGFQISAAKQINAAFAKLTARPRRGSVFSDRYHATIITSPRQIRHALAYVLSNWRKHGEDRDSAMARYRIDWFSSAPKFEGWAEYHGPPLRHAPAGYLPLQVSPAQTWLLSVGWKRYGASLSCFDVPSRS
jgi:REP element-mobilizing transposase RayT